MDKYVVGIGAANVDIYCKSNIRIREHYDHPSIINTTVGGVTRNILENIARLGVNAKILTAIGDDIYGGLVKEKSKEAGIDVDDVLVVKGGHTGIFMQVQDNNNDMHLALCDMSISKNIDVKYLSSKKKVFKNAEAIILDPSLDNEVIEYILDTYNDIPVFVDPISDNYAKKIKPYLNKLYCIKPNKTELEVLASMKIKNDDDLNKAIKKVIAKGTKCLYVSLGSKGCLYADDNGNVIRRKFKAVNKMVNASGAGDAFFAATVHGFVNGLTIGDTIDKALAAGIVAIQSETTINPKMSVKLLNKIIKENR